MHFQYTPYIFPLIVAAAISSWVAIYIWRHRSARSATALAFMALAITEWCLGYALEIAGTDLPTKVLWGKVQYIGIVMAPLMWLIFAFNHSSQAERLTRRNIALLTTIPLITLILVFTTELHNLVWQETHINQAANFTVLGVSYGPWFWIHSIYSYVLLLIGTVLILRSIGRMEGLYRGQTAMLIIAVFVPWAGNALYLLNFSPIPFLDLTPFAFTISILALTWGIFGFRLVDVSPIAREIVVEEMKDGMIVLDAQDRIADINLCAQQMVGLPAGQVVGRKLSEALSSWSFLTKRYRNAMEALAEEAIGEGEAKRWYELRLSPLYDRRKRSIGRLIMMHDITDRRRVDEKVRQLSRAVEASPTSIVITDADGKILYVNPKFTQVTGYTLEEAIGQNPRILKTEFTPAEVHRQLWETIRAGHEWRGEFCNRKKNGEIYWELASISPIIDAAGNISQYVAIKEDITERKRVAEELARAHEQALEASRYKTELLAKVSHELRTPLGAILGYTEILHKELFAPLTEQQKHFTSEILDSAGYLGGLINDLLDESQIERGKIRIEVAPFNLREMVDQTSVSLRSLAEAKGLSFTAEVDPGMPITLIGDQKRLRQILNNLVSNAIKFTETGSVTARIQHADAGRWAIQVADTGPGINPEAQNNIYDAFWQVDGFPTLEQKGYGLGLSIVKQLIDLIGGEIKLESEVGKGSSFTVVLPFMSQTTNEEQFDSPPDVEPEA